MGGLLLSNVDDVLAVAKHNNNVRDNIGRGIRSFSTENRVGDNNSVVAIASFKGQCANRELEVIVAIACCDVSHPCVDFVVTVTVRIGDVRSVGVNVVVVVPCMVNDRH